MPMEKLCRITEHSIAQHEARAGGYESSLLYTVMRDEESGQIEQRWRVVRNHFRQSPVKIKKPRNPDELAGDPMQPKHTETPHKAADPGSISSVSSSLQAL